jgi:hypothetical protein
MPIDVFCKSFGETFQVDDRYAGRKGKCPHCKAVVAAPEGLRVELQGDQHGVETDIGVRELVGGVDPSRAPEKRDDWKPRWKARLRFTAGVLGIMFGVWMVGSIRDFLFYNPYDRDSRLRDDQLCTVEDFLQGNTFGPTRCYVYDQEFQRNPIPKDYLNHIYE